MRQLARRLNPYGVFWRKFLEWGTTNVPYFLEPLIVSIWSFLFYLGWSSGRRGLSANLKVVASNRSSVVRTVMAVRVFWNFAAVLSETMHFTLRRQAFDWELVGADHFQQLRTTPGGAIILTAHMGNYDLGSYLFANEIEKKIMIVRAPERDPESERDARARRREFGEETGKLVFGSPSAELALDLVAAIQEGMLVAIQGDRTIDGVSSHKVQFFGREVSLPSGPFALALATRAPIFPLFIVRARRRSYRVISERPIICRRTGPDRDRDIAAAMAEWASLLERIVAQHATQWFSFQRIFAKTT